MTNVEKLEESGYIEDIRERLGGVNTPNAIQDEEINKMSALEIAKAWSGWNLGNTEWATTIIDIYRLIEE